MQQDQFNHTIRQRVVHGDSATWRLDFSVMAGQFSARKGHAFRTGPPTQIIRVADWMESVGPPLVPLIVRPGTKQR